MPNTLNSTALSFCLNVPFSVSQSRKAVFRWAYQGISIKPYCQTLEPLHAEALDAQNLPNPRNRRNFENP